jgi:hypothetical protein
MPRFIVRRVQRDGAAPRQALRLGLLLGQGREVGDVLGCQHAARRDFVGHVGGDDFMLLLQSEDWQQRCEDIVGAFAGEARQLFDATRTTPMDSVVQAKNRRMPWRSSAQMPPASRAWSSNSWRASPAKAPTMSSQRCCQSSLCSSSMKSSPPTWPTKSRRASQCATASRATRRIIWSQRQ